MAVSRVILCPRLLTPSSRSSAFVSSGRWIPWMSLSLKVSLYWAMFMESNQPHTSSQSQSNTGFSKNGCLKDNIIQSKNLYKTEWRKLDWNLLERKNKPYFTSNGSYPTWYWTENVQASLHYLSDPTGSQRNQPLNWLLNKKGLGCDPNLFPAKDLTRYLEKN